MQRSQFLENPTSEGNLASSMPYSTVFGYLMPALIGIVGVNAQGINKPSSETNAASMWSFIVATAFYCIALGADIKSRLGRANTSHLMWGLIAVISGSLSSVSLISTFVPRLVSYIILGIAWVCAAIVIVVYQYGRLFKDESRRLHNKILKPFFSQIWNRFKADNTMAEEQQRSPV